MKKWQKCLRSIAACTMALIAFGSCGIIGGGTSNSVGSDSSMESSVKESKCTIKFDLCTDLKTNNIMDQEVEIGETVNKPIVAVIGDNPNNEEVEGWYTDAEYTKKWNFLIDVVESDMTLYAKWICQYSVKYYLGDNLKTPMYEEQYREGELLNDMSVLSDGYRSDGFFLDPEYTEKVEFGTPVTQPMNIYIHRSDNFYFSAEMIERRFTPVAAPSGAGSTAGSLELGGEGEDTYVKANFGYSTAGDPHILLKNVTVDISASQKIRVTFKNMGNASTLKFYFVAWYDDETKEFVDMPHFTEKTACTYRYFEDEKNMTEDSEWLVKELDLAAATVHNGVSLWGNASTLVQLRIDSGYVSTSKDDLSNEVWIKSIEGIPDPTYVQTDDSAEVQEILKDDEAAAVQAVADSQQDVVGWVFPKDNAQAAGSAETYNKTEGLVMYSPFRQTGTTLVLTPSDNERIDLEEMTTLKIRLRNYGYGTSLKIRYRNKLGRSAECNLSINARSEVTEYTLNMFGANNWTGVLENLSIVYDSVGIDNAILFESIEFSEFEVIQIPGFNFNDKYMFGVESNEQMAVEYDFNNKGTKFNVLENGASFEKVYENRFTTIGYDGMTLNYAMANEGITKVIVELTTVYGEAEPIVSTYTYDVVAGEGAQSLYLPFEAKGLVKNIKVSFEGTGEITICSLKFKLPVTALDWSDAGFVASVAERFKWALTTSYDVGLSAAKYSQSGPMQYMNAYMGAMYDVNVGDGNFSLEGKTKIAIIYQNRGTANFVELGFGLTDVTEDDTWKPAISQPGDPTSGGMKSCAIETEMGEDEWLTAELDLTTFKNLTAENLAEKAMTCIHCIFTNPNYVGTLYVRAIVVY